MTDLKSINGKRILLVIGGGIAAYKALELVRAVQQNGGETVCVMTKAAAQFVTPLSAASLSGQKVYSDLFSLTDEAEMGHIELSRSADVVAVVPATADLLGKMAGGLADDLASTLLLATDKRILVAPAMNVRMWLHPATRRNIQTLTRDGVRVVGPEDGEMACGEFGPGRMAEPQTILAALAQLLAEGTFLPLPAMNVPSLPTPERPLAGRKVVITAGPTHEPIDPVRYLANRSSGKQGYAIAAAASAAGALVILISGPVLLDAPEGVEIVRVETADEMQDAVSAALPADIFVGAAAVADWKAAHVSAEKIKKGSAEPAPVQFVKNPDILKSVAQHTDLRPQLVVGFAAETSDLIENAKKKHEVKQCDIIVANDVRPETGVMGGDFNTVHIVSRCGVEEWPRLGKSELATKLIYHFAALLQSDKL